uniref:Uncharacterized protein n=1 Tax=Daucus carota subsp. sativus TaxID=79200 RepID=A0A175YMJ4_DAUCS
MHDKANDVALESTAKQKLQRERKTMIQNASLIIFSHGNK